MRKSRTLGKKFLCYFSIIIALLMIWQYSQEIKEWQYYKERYPGKLYTVNNHVVHGYKKGQGKENFIFIAGAGTPIAYTDFSLLQDKLSKDAVTVSYDQPGFGWSQLWKGSTDIDNRVKQLDQLLEMMDLEGRYTFVAHSLGSLEAIRYAQMFPKKVKGIVILDSVSPEFYAKDGIVKYAVLNRSCALLRRTGILRVMGEMGFYLPVGGEDCRYSRLSQEMQKMDLAFYYKNLGSKSSFEGIMNLHKNADKVVNGGKLKKIPIYTIYSDGKKDFSTTERGLSNWSDINETAQIDGAKHYIHWSNLDEVYELICKWAF